MVFGKPYTWYVEAKDKFASFVSKIYLVILIQNIERYYVNLSSDNSSKEFILRCSGSAMVEALRQSVNGCGIDLLVLHLGTLWKCLPQIRND